MDLNVGTIKLILNLYDEMRINGIELVYFGEIGHDITKSFALMSDINLQKQEEAKNTQKKVYHILIETMQNLNKHSDWFCHKNNVGSGIFLIGRKKDKHFIITSNKILKSKKLALETYLNSLLNASLPDLDEMYDKQLKEGKISEKGGAGLGLIDIARKSNKQMQFQFLSLEDNSYLFILKAEIDASNNI